ncbi:MAG: hypothetical protein VR64_13435 [Desulfatitalea sp. BRH_c12]|nr:MAG: hypothetical protein VR64_13435 [Desulfatitalea sp. BRH_c12]
MANQGIFFRRRSALPLTAGLVAAQGIAFWFVGKSNLELQQSMRAVQTAGWLPLPAGSAADSLSTATAAFWGGLFYTLSVGAGLALATWAILYLWQRLFSDRPKLLWGALALWSVLLLAINFRGWAFFPTLFGVAVPLAVFLGAVRTRPPSVAMPSRLWPVPLITLALLTGIWATQMNAQLFTTIRDYLLLSNPAGQAVNDFYYRYTLHAAQTFKSFDQRTLRVARFASADDAQANEPLIATLARHDVVTITQGAPVDMTLLSSGEHLVLVSNTNDRLTITKAEFLSDPGPWLRRFSEMGDRHAPLRRLTFAGLLLGFPILLFVLVDGLIGRLAGIFTHESAQIWLRAAFCLVIGIGLFIPILIGRQPDVARPALGAALDSGHWPERVAALRLVARENIDLAAFPQYRSILNSALVVERYYLARALAASRRPGTLPDLFALIRDAHPNVVCQAFYALGKRRNRAAIVPIQAQVMTSDHWYVQWYGYRAMRSLGWHQRRSH